MMKTIRLLLAALALAGSGCTSFEPHWKAAADSSRTRGCFDGRWQGRWTSEKHRGLSGKPESGDLRLVLARTGPGKYRANIQAHWLVFRSNYQVTLEGRERGNLLRLRGQQNARPIFGGPYRYDGVVTRGRFSMRYDSRYDRGRVELVRADPSAR